MRAIHSSCRSCCRSRLVAAGCDGEINNIPTTPDPVFVTETFTGTLTINGARDAQRLHERDRRGDGDR